MSKIKGTWKKLLEAQKRGSRVGTLALLFCLGSLPACIKRSQVEAEIWSQTGLPKELCERVPELRQYGLFRVLDGERYEFQGYCVNAHMYKAMHQDKLNEFLKELEPKSSVQQEVPR